MALNPSPGATILLCHSSLISCTEAEWRGCHPIHQQRWKRATLVSLSLSIHSPSPCNRSESSLPFTTLDGYVSPRLSLSLPSQSEAQREAKSSHLIALTAPSSRLTGCGV